jgi:hypothetical protein
VNGAGNSGRQEGEEVANDGEWTVARSKTNSKPKPMSLAKDKKNKRFLQKSSAAASAAADPREGHRRQRSAAVEAAKGHRSTAGLKELPRKVSPAKTLEKTEHSKSSIDKSLKNPEKLQKILSTGSREIETSNSGGLGSRFLETPKTRKAGKQCAEELLQCDDFPHLSSWADLPETRTSPPSLAAGEDQEVGTGDAGRVPALPNEASSEGAGAAPTPHRPGLDPTPSPTKSFTAESDCDGESEYESEVESIASVILNPWVLPSDWTRSNPETLNQVTYESKELQLQAHEEFKVLISLCMQELRKGDEFEFLTLVHLLNKLWAYYYEVGMKYHALLCGAQDMLYNYEHRDLDESNFVYYLQEFFYIVNSDTDETMRIEVSEGEFSCYLEREELRDPVMCANRFEVLADKESALKEMDARGFEPRHPKTKDDNR